LLDGLLDGLLALLSWLACSAEWLACYAQGTADVAVTLWFLARWAQSDFVARWA